MKALLIVAGAVLCGQMAFATVELNLVSGASNTTVVGAGGNVSFTSANFNGWNISVVAGASNSPNLTGVHGLFGIDLTSLTATCVTSQCSSSPLDVFLSDTGFTQAVPLHGFTSTFSTTQSGGSSTQFAWDDTTNTIFGQQTAIGTVGPFTATNHGSTSGGGPAGPAAYSLTIEDVFSAGGAAASFSSDGNITAAPEPVSMILLGTVLAICGSKLRSRRQNS
jgi:hypothetical protein